MDYKYIEQLLERYWECETSQEEEQILRAFFSQKMLPASLARYKSLFDYEQQQAQVSLGADFDARLLEAIGENPEAQELDEEAKPKVVRTRHMTLVRRLQPLYRAAAAVAIVTVLGIATQHSFTSPTPGADVATSGGYNMTADGIENTPTDENSMKMKQLIKQGQETASADSSKLLNPTVSTTAPQE